MIIIAITLLGLALRLVLANQSLWLDEAASVIIASLPIKTFFQSLAGDFHPPLYYLLLKPWIGLVGKNELLLRLPGIVVGALTVPALYLLVGQMFPKKHPSQRSMFTIAHLAALLLALNPLHVYYSQELRMYSLSALLATLSWYFLVKWLNKKPSGSLSWVKADKNLALFTTVTIISFYIFYLSVFILASQWFYTAFYHKKRLKTFTTYNLLFVISLLPWLPILLKQMGGGGYLAKALPGWAGLSGNLSLKSIALIPIKFSLGRISILPKELYYLGAGLTLIFVSLLFWLALRVKRSRLFAFWLFVPLALGVVSSLAAPMLGYWRYIFLLPAFTTLLSIGLASLPKKILALNLSLLILLFLSSNLYFFLNPRFHRENWSSFAKLINAQKQETLVIVNFTDAFAPLKFYLPETKVFPTQIRLGETRPDIDKELSPLLGKDIAVYYLDYLSDITSPARPILTWLKRAGLKQSNTYQFEGLGVVYEYQAP